MILNNLLQDWKSNKRNIKGRLILLMFRIAAIGSKNKYLFLFLLPYLIFYRITIEWILGIELPYKTKIGKGLVIHHGQALIINDSVQIGNNCILRHCTTIGNKQIGIDQFSPSPIIGNNVDIGSNVCIIGPIKIGDNVKIGAGSVIVKDIPSNSIVVGNPARIIKTIMPI